MGLFDIFTAKKQLTALINKANVEAILNTARAAIVDQIKTQLTGAEKKSNVDQVVIGVIEANTRGCTNSIVKWVISLIISTVPSITQIAYDFLKEKVENL